MRPSASGSRLFLANSSSSRLVVLDSRPASSSAAPAAEDAPELGAGMHDEMHGRADPGIGPFAGSAAARRPQRDQPRGAGAAGEQQHHGAEHEEGEAGDERDGGVGQERPDHMGAGHEEIAENAAEPVRQRPALRLGQGGQSRGQQDDRAAGQASSRILRRAGVVRNTRCQPQAASGRNRMIEASPSDWMARSATTAPQLPSTLRGGARSRC